MKKTAALIMPALNEAQSVALTLNSVFASTRLPDEIIVADGGSQDETVALIKRFSDRGVTIKIVNNLKVYAGAGRNVAVEQTDCDIILLLDFGNTIAPDWIDEMLTPFEQDESVEYVCGIFQPIVRSDYEHCVACIHYHNNALIDRVPINELIRQTPKKFSPGALSFAITRSLWQRVGGMPDWLRAAEDSLFGRKVYNLNVKFALVPQARQYHHMRSNSLDLFKQLFTYSRGDARTGLVRAHFLKLCLLILCLISVLALPVFWVPKAIGCILITGLFVAKTGLTKILRVDGGLKKKSFLLTATQVVLARDLGTVLGNFVGFYEWVFHRKFRRLFKCYANTTQTLRDENNTLNVPRQGKVVKK